MDSSEENRSASFGERLRELRQARGLSIEALAYATRDASAGNGVTISYIGMLERGLRYPSLATIELLAATLEVDPTEFPEYMLAKARELLDERQVGLAGALENLSDLRAALKRALATDD